MPNISNHVVLKTGNSFEFEDASGAVRQKFLQYLQCSAGASHVCNLPGLKGQEIILDLREVAAVVSRPK